jgi:hypothetical protein
MCPACFVETATAARREGRWPERVGVPGARGRFSGGTCVPPSGPPKNAQGHTDAKAARLHQNQCGFRRKHYRDSNPASRFFRDGGSIGVSIAREKRVRRAVTQSWSNETSATGSHSN